MQESMDLRHVYAHFSFRVITKCVKPIITTQSIKEKITGSTGKRRKKIACFHLTQP